MLGKTHKVGGLAFGSIIPAVVMYNMESINPIPLVIVTLTGSILGSLIPDLDHENSTLSRRVGFLSKLVSKPTRHRGITHSILGLFIYSLIAFALMSLLTFEYTLYGTIIICICSGFVFRYAFKFILNLARNLPRVTRKGIRYSSYIAFIIGVLVAFLYNSTIPTYATLFILGTIVGYLSHIILDLFNVQGVPLFTPFTKQHFRLARIYTGSFLENIVYLVCILIAIIGLLFCFCSLT